MLKATVRIVGDKALIAKLKALSLAAQGWNLARAAKAGILPIQNEAIILVAKDTGTLSRSIHNQITLHSHTYAEVECGTDLDYAARIEFGFMQADRLGRHYNQPAQPYMRPAFDGKKSAAENETRAALTDLINAASK